MWPPWIRHHFEWISVVHVFDLYAFLYAFLLTKVANTYDGT
jgi:hypothetical protein